MLMMEIMMRVGILDESDADNDDDDYGGGDGDVQCVPISICASVPESESVKNMNVRMLSLSQFHNGSKHALVRSRWSRQG